MKIVILAVGRLKEEYLRRAEAEYRKRLRSYCQIEVVETKDEERLLSAIPEGAKLYALDERGDLVTSEQIAHDILGDHAMHGGGAPLAFAVGGPDGHSARLRGRAARLLAFGRITIAHRLARLLLFEQIYRGFRILRGEPYHR